MSMHTKKWWLQEKYILWKVCPTGSVLRTIPISLAKLFEKW